MRRREACCRRGHGSRPAHLCPHLAEDEPSVNYLVVWPRPGSFTLRPQPTGRRDYPAGVCFPGGSTDLPSSDLSCQAGVGRRRESEGSDRGGPGLLTPGLCCQSGCLLPILCSRCLSAVTSVLGGYQLVLLSLFLYLACIYFSDVFVLSAGASKSLVTAGQRKGCWEYRSVLPLPGSCPSDARAGRCSHRALPPGRQCVRSRMGLGAALRSHMDCRAPEFPTGTGEMRAALTGER